MPSPPSFFTVLLAFVVSAGIALAARRAHTLSTSGAIAATIGGTLSIAAGWTWGIFVVVWFLYASVLSRAGRRRKAMQTAGIVAKGGRRDAWQVLANGGVYFALAAAAIIALTLALPEHAALAAQIAAASLIAAGADTTATEVGTWWQGTPVSLRTWSRVPPGTSGAVSVPGTTALVAAALLLTGMAVAIGLVPPEAFWPVAVAGIAGALIDTLLGAIVQSRRYCAFCGESTEQLVHRCDTATRADGGWNWMTNDMVNLLCTVTAALIAGGWLTLLADR
ncbi:MAG TPA: DUF92 domain-containing protein [Gemmatimonas sp.]|uniref:DUF92 domain-containing protein n=1 Tax=Gemmatimonas sp. TaxID=1962908 RepID=UPI002ED83546